MTPLFVQGVPDDQQVYLHMPEGGGRVQPVFPGTLDVLGQFDSQRAWPVLYLPPASSDLKKVPKATALINHMADADRYAQALQRLESLRTQLRLPCLNAPLAVAATTRDGVSRLLEGVEGLRVPKAVRFAPKVPGDFARVFAENGFGYPVITRLTGTQTGRTLVRVDDPAGWDQLNGVPWGGQEMYMIQAVLSPGADGRFRKLRIAFVGGRIIVRHYITAQDWMVHAESRAPDTEAESIAWMQRFEQDFLPRHEATLHEIERRLGLDLFGLDCSLLPDGRLLLFEANASMSLVKVVRPAFMPFAQKVHDAIEELLRTPARWKFQPAAEPA